MHETWTDTRLKFISNSDDNSIVLPSRLISKLWVPDLYIVGSKSSFIHKTTVDNLVLRLFNDGSIFYNVKITTTVACQMNLYNFPLDMENCSLTFQSLGYTSDEVNLEWMVGSHMEDLFMDTRLVTSMPKFQLVHHNFHSRNVTITEADRYAGMRSQLKVSFELKRYLLSVFFQSYFPALIMVVLAGLGMWIDPRSVPARVALGVTSVLTISTIITGLKASLPKVSYLTAMDIYLWVCFLFVFSTVLEFCCLNFIMTERGKKSLKKFQQTIPAPAQIEKYPKIKPSIVRNGITSQSKRKDNKDSQSTRYQHHKLSDDVAIIFRSLPSLGDGQEDTKSTSTDLTPKHPKGLKMQVPSSLQRINPRKCLPSDAESLDVFFRVGYFYSFLVFNGIYWGYYVMATQHEGGEES
uniref:gamma-aminobutyric acid receptor subunit rho-2-like n=1 Tax=Ciona intestinalis TaxID=7719 RepID=UPI000EF43C54|nr:gamma-aminobutyric acid receptor subunit rho-2-like [Ciona intestinalis]|eukprot:XP_018671511.2 gamma-aminobutyric acid receptor subunit rho-2-like [Ciona intestinalis]